MIIGAFARPKKRKPGSGGKRPGSGRKKKKNRTAFEIRLFNDEVKSLGGVKEARRLATEHLVMEAQLMIKLPV